MDRTKNTPLPDSRTPLEHSNPWHSERIIALGPTPGSPAKHLALIMASGVAFLLIGLISGTVYWILGVVMFIIGLIAHCTSPAPSRSSDSRIPIASPVPPRSPETRRP
jgi:hypothetical protein